MKKMIGIGSSSERKDLLKLLTKLGCVEVAQCDDKYGGEQAEAEREYDKANVKLARLEFASRFLQEQKIASKSLKDDNTDKDKGGEKKKKELPLALRPKPEIEFERFAKAREWESETFDKVKKLEEYNSDLIALKAEEAKLTNKRSQLMPYRDIAIKLSAFEDTAYTKVLLGTIKGTEISKIAEIESAFGDVLIETFGEGESIAIAVICTKESFEEISAKLSDLDFTVCGNMINELPATALKDIEIRLKEIEYRRAEITREVSERYLNDDFNLELMRLKDFYNVELQKVEAIKNMRTIKSVCLFECWLPAESEKIVDEKLSNSDLTLAYVIREPLEEETPPTLCVNNSIVTPYQSVTNMFNVPSYSEINPNPFVAFFFILFFGVMISDAGYGLLMALGAGIMLLLKKPRKNEMALVKIIFAGGLSTIFWGILFGGYFGIDSSIIEAAGIWYWFSPINDPITMLFLSLGLGLFQMLTGMGINAYALFKQKKPLDAIFGVFSWYALLGGLAMFALGGKIAGVKYTGLALLIAGLVGMMIAGALHKKGLGKVSGAFGNLYGIINFFSDLLSYTRLFGLGLATGVIALVFNQIAMVIIDINVFIGAIMAPLILIVGHTFNIGINTLGAYVHNSRLQFVEFFGKFYEGGGELFVPLGSAMTYYNFTVEIDQATGQVVEKKKKLFSK